MDTEEKCTMEECWKNFGEFWNWVRHCEIHHPEAIEEISKGRS